MTWPHSSAGTVAMSNFAVAAFHGKWQYVCRFCMRLLPITDPTDIDSIDTHLVLSLARFGYFQHTYR